MHTYFNIKVIPDSTDLCDSFRAGQECYYARVYLSLTIVLENNPGWQMPFLHVMAPGLAKNSVLYRHVMATHTMPDSSGLTCGI